VGRRSADCRGSVLKKFDRLLKVDQNRGVGGGGSKKAKKKETYMRYLIAESAGEDVMMGTRVDKCFLVSGESIGHKFNRCA
jgi:hypothetical protein